MFSVVFLGLFIFLFVSAEEAFRFGKPYVVVFGGVTAAQNGIAVVFCFLFLFKNYAKDPSLGLIEFWQHAGEVVYLPEGWWHAGDKEERRET